METVVSRQAFGSPHCAVCPMFLGQAVPVVRTDHGYALFCEVCALGHGPVTVRSTQSRAVSITVEDEGDAVASSEEE